MDALEELIRAGPDPRYKVKAVVLQRHRDIATARQLMRTWPDITEALGFDRGQWKQVSACFHRVDAGVKAGKLKPGASKSGETQRAKSERQPPAPPAESSSVVVNYGGFDKPKPKHVFDDDK